MAIDEESSEEGTFYVDGVEVESCVDHVNLKANEKDEGYVTMHIRQAH